MSPTAQLHRSAPPVLSPHRHRAERRTWVADLALGCRLAVRDRSSVLRIVFTAMGVALSLAIILGVASVPPAINARTERADSLNVNGVNIKPTDPRVATTVQGFDDSYRGRTIHTTDVIDATAETVTPPGVAQLPAPGELVVSPALKDLLESPEGELLRPRYPGDIVGLIGPAGLLGPQDLRAYRGTAPFEPIGGGPSFTYVAAWGAPGPPETEVILILTAIAAGIAAVVLIPPLTFVSMAGRLASASRDRRLAAMRLAGVSANQARRVAAGETLPASLLGLALGILLFYLARLLVPGLAFGGESLFAADLAPGWVATLTAAVALPALTIAVAVLGLRRVVVEPLGVARRGATRRRRVLWRFVPLMLGGAALAVLVNDRQLVQSDEGTLLLVVGTVLTLVAVPLLMPALVDTVVRRVPTGNTAGWTLAVRRLQADPESSSRIVSGIAVTLAGVVVLQGLLSFVGDLSTRDRTAVQGGFTSLYLAGDDRSLGMTKQIAQIPGVATVLTTVMITLQPPGNDISTGAEQVWGSYASCATVSAVIGMPCRDGAVYLVPFTAGGDNYPAAPPAGTELEVVDYLNSGPDGTPQSLPRTVVMPEPTKVTGTAGRRNGGGVVLFTPKSLPYTQDQLLSKVGSLGVDVYADGDAADVTELVRNVVATDPAVAAQTYVYGTGQDRSPGSAVNQTISTLQTLLIVIGSSIIVLAMGALIVTAADQIAERRATFANLAASGFPRAVLARSVMYAAALPALISVVLASIAGAGLTSVFISLTGQDVDLAIAPILGLAGAAVVLVLLSVAATLPAVRSATRPERLRLE